MRIAPFANGLWWLSCLPERLRYERACYRVKQTQERVLLEILRANQDSGFGREHRFGSLSCLAEYQAAVPLMDCGDLVGRVHQLTSEEVLMLEPTGGSTAGSRLIPYTASLRSQFQRAIATWVGDLFWRHPGLMLGTAYWAITPPAPEQEGLGFDHDGEYLGPLGRWVLKHTLAVPPETKNSSDFWGETCRGLLAASDLRLISVWSPSFLLLLADRVKRLSGRWTPQAWWPHLQCLSCWTDAQAGALIPEVRRLFPGVAIQAKGLLATEGVVTVPVGDVRPLCLRSHVFEFLSGSRSYFAWELEVGQTYEVLLTTGGGLYRYRLGDRVQVTGHYGDCPCLQFLGRDRVADRFGEKLHEEHVARALELVCGFAMLAYEGGGYVLFLDGEASGELLSGVEHSLLENFHYRHCQELGQLRSLRAFQIEGDGHRAYLQACQQLGQRLGDIKPVPLHPYEGWSGLLEGSFLASG